MVAKTDVFEEDLEKLVVGKPNGFGITESNCLFLAQAIGGDPEAAGNGGSPVFTEPATADGYARLSIASAFTASTADPDSGISNAVGAQLATASAPWAEIRWGGIAKAGVRGVNDALLLTVLSDGLAAVGVASALTQTVLCGRNCHPFTTGMLISFNVLPGGTAPGGLTCSITKQYKVTTFDQSAGTFSISDDQDQPVTITSDGNVRAVRVVPIQAGQVAPNTAVTFPPGTISYAEG